jgi:hypothetical protein
MYHGAKLGGRAMVDGQANDRAWEGAPPDSTSDAPPTTRGIVAPASTTSWPTVFGVISVLLGALGVFGGIVGIATTLLLPSVLPQAYAQFLQLPGPMRAASIASSALNVLLAGLLTSAGIGLLRRRRWAVGATRTWAIMKIVLSVVGIGIGWWTQSWLRQHPSSNASGTSSPLSPQATAVIQAISLLFALAWAWAWPIVCLVWLSRPRVRAEWEAWGRPGADDVDAQRYE